MKLSTVLLAASLLAAGATSARANFLTYIDEKGTKHVVQSEDEIPEKYRKDVKVSSAGGAPSFFTVDVPYQKDPRLSARKNCEKEAVYNFDFLKKKLFGKVEGSLSPEDMKNFNDLTNRRESARAKCQALSDAPPGSRNPSRPDDKAKGAATKAAPAAH